MVKIYTKTGDKGETSLFGGKRVSKADLRVETYGEIDELNSLIGIIIFKIKNSKVKSGLSSIQSDLFELGSRLASSNTKYKMLDIKYLNDRVSKIEQLIDDLSKELQELHNFILPGGGKAGSLLHFARAVCRRVERQVVAFSEKEKVSSEIIVYFNRLSDLLFTMARFVNFKEKRKETIWSSVAKIREDKSKKITG